MGTPRPDLLDPSQYTVIPKVAVVDTFRLPIPSEENEGEYEYFDITQEFLERVAYNGNRREVETGDMCPIILGRHTKAKAAETAQPRIVGYARNWTVGPLGNTDRTAAYADFWIKNEEVEEVKKYPRRSAEIWRGRAEIDPIALLGATTPERDLGLLPIALQRHPKKQEISCTYYLNRAIDMPHDEMNANKQPATPANEDINALLQKVVAALSDNTTKLDQLLSAMSGASGAGEGGEAGKGEVGAGSGEGEPHEEMTEQELMQLIEELEKEHAGGGQGGEGSARKEEEPAKAMAYAGGQNTYVPNTEKPSKMSRNEDNPEVVKLREELEAIKLQRAHEEISAKVDKLIESGVMIEDRDAEIRDIMALPAEMRPALLNRIEKHYKRAPVRGILPAVQHSATAGGATISDEQRQVVIKLARDEGLSYEGAFKKQFGRYPWEQPKV